MLSSATNMPFCCQDAPVSIFRLSILRLVGARRRVARGVGDSRGAEPERKLTGDEKAEQEVLRILLANDGDWRDAGVARDLFTLDVHRTAFEVIWPAVEGAPPGGVLDLGRLIGEDDSLAGRLLRRLAFDDRPLAEIDDLVNKLKVTGLVRRIDTLRRVLEQIDPDQDAEAYSDRFNELIALERERRELRSED